MTTPNGTHLRNPTPPTDDMDLSKAPVSTLRGAPVEFNVRVVARVAAVVFLVGLVTLVAILFAAGAQKNAQISDLRARGVPVKATVSGCLGLLGGSGSNSAGYTCRAGYTFGGRHYNEPIPDNALHRPGTTLRLITAPDDPALISTPAALASERASSSVYLVPTALLASLLVLGAAVILKRKRRSPGESANVPSAV